MCVYVCVKKCVRGKHLCIIITLSVITHQKVKNVNSTKDKEMKPNCTHFKFPIVILNIVTEGYWHNWQQVYY